MERWTPPGTRPVPRIGENEYTGAAAERRVDSRSVVNLGRRA